MIFYIFITKSLTIWTDTLCLAYEWNWFYSILTGSIQYKTHVLIFTVTILHILSILNLTYLFVVFFLTSYDLTKKVIWYIFLSIQNYASVYVTHCYSNLIQGSNVGVLSSNTRSVWLNDRLALKISFIKTCIET